MDQNSANIPLPNNIRANLASGERILFSDEGVQLSKADKVMKWMLVGICGLAIVALGMTFPKLFSNPSNEMTWIIFLMVPIGLVIGFVFLKKISLSSRTGVYVSDRKVYSYTKMKMIGPLNDFIHSFELKQLQGIGVRDIKRLPDGTTLGTVDLYSEQAAVYHGYKLSLPNVSDILRKVKRIDSIAWHYRKRIPSLQEPTRIQLDPTFMKKTYRNSKLFAVTTIVCLFAIGLGAIGLSIFRVTIPRRGGTIPAELQFPLAMEMISIFLLAFGIAFFIVVGLMLGLTTRKVLGSPEITELEIGSEYFQFNGGQQTLRIPFKEDLFLNVIHPRALGMTSAIAFGSLSDPMPPIIFGPLANYFAPFETIYASLLTWKARTGLLMSLADIDKKSDDFTSRTQDWNVLPEQRRTPAPVNSTLLQNLEIPPSEKPLLEKYLDPGEKVVFIYKPDVDLKRDLAIGFIGIGGFVLFIFVMTNMQEITNTSIMLFIGMFMGSFLLCMPGMIMGWCMVLNKQMTKKMLYVFTRSKMIVKYPNRVVSVKYDNIAFIDQREYRGKIVIEIHLLKPLDLSARFPTPIIVIPAIQKNSDLFDRIKALKDYLPR